MNHYSIKFKSSFIQGRSRALEKKKADKTLSHRKQEEYYQKRLQAAEQKRALEARYERYYDHHSVSQYYVLSQRLRKMHMMVHIILHPQKIKVNIIFNSRVSLEMSKIVA